MNLVLLSWNTLKNIKQDVSRVKEDLTYYFPIVSLLPRGPYSQNRCKEQCGTLKFPGPLLWPNIHPLLQILSFIYYSIF